MDISENEEDSEFDRFSIHSQKFSEDAERLLQSNRWAWVHFLKSYSWTH
jgi:hypothetical protein